jgi:hypothetical protein
MAACKMSCSYIQELIDDLILVFGLVMAEAVWPCHGMASGGQPWH